MSTVHRDNDMTSPDKFVPALLVVDMQNDFISGSLAVPEGSTIVGRINQLLDLPFKVKVATQDFHPDDHVSFAKTHGREPFSSKLVIYHPDDVRAGDTELVPAAGMEQILWPVHCVAHTHGAEFVAGLKTDKFSAVVRKGTHPSIESYSAFRDIWHRGVSELPGLLLEHAVTDVFVTGLAGDYCVKYTALDAVAFGYRTWVVGDAVKSIAQDEPEVVLGDLTKSGAMLINTEEVIKLVSSPKSLPFEVS